MRKLVIELLNVIILKWERTRILNREGSVGDIFFPSSHNITLLSELKTHTIVPR